MWNPVMTCGYFVIINIEGTLKPHVQRDNPR